MTTGPLGQGLASAVGLAIAEAQLAANYNREGFEIFDNYTYVFCGDGCLQEGITSEASSLAGHLGLHKLVVVYDDNKITIDGETELSFTEDVAKRYDSYGWYVQTVEKGDDDIESLEKCIHNAKSQKSKPSIIILKTTIGYGSSKEGTEAVHGAPLGKFLSFIVSPFPFSHNFSVSYRFCEFPSSKHDRIFLNNFSSFLFVNRKGRVEEGEGKVWVQPRRDFRDRL